MEKKITHETRIRVRYGETDQMGYCYYGNYAQFLEVGRVETLRSIGMSYKSLEESGIMLPVANFSIDYKIPAKYDDELIIATTITAIKGARIIFDYTITVNNKLIATATTTLVFVTKETMRPTSAPENFLQLINNL